MNESVDKSVRGRLAPTGTEESEENPWSRIKIRLGIMAAFGILILIAGTMIFPELKFAGDSRVVLQQRVDQLELALAERNAVIEELRKRPPPAGPDGVSDQLTTFSLQGQQRIALQNAISRTQLLEIRAELTEIQSDCKVLVAASDTWHSTQDGLLSNDAGRKLAASADCVKQFVALTEKDRISQSRVDSLQQQLKLLSDVLGNPPKPEETVVVPDATFTSRLTKLGREIHNASLELKRDADALGAILAASADNSAKGPTLFIAIETEQRDSERRRIEQIEKARAEAIAQANKDQAAAEKAKVAAEEKIATLLIQRDAKMAEQTAVGLDQDIADGIQAAILARDKKRRRKEALTQEVLTLLAPLTTPDYSQPYQILGTGADGKRTVEKQPVSFSRIKSLGVLERTETGLKKLALLNATNWTKRPRWNMAYEAPEPRLWSTSQQDMIVKTQTYLIKYGDILAEEGILAP